MSFGQPTTAPDGDAPQGETASGRTRRGGYPLGLLALVAAAYLGAVAMSLVPSLNPRGTPVLAILEVATRAVFNLTLFAALPMLLVDLLLRTLNWRRPWIYALSCGLTLYALCAIPEFLIDRSVPVFLIGIALWPGAACGWVMGLFRR